ncbi:MAG TPA: PIN domain-containing protein [Blastocatellia bacterium]
MTPKPLRLFTDSNILIGAMVSRWGLDKAIVALCAARVCRLVLCDPVREEVEENPRIQAGQLPSDESRRLAEEYSRFLRLTRPESVPYPDEREIIAGRHMIRHLADVPVLLCAIAAKPDWLLTHNTEHFSPSVSQATGLRIARPKDFFVALTRSSASA